jgi:hypothetical protein
VRKVAFVLASLVEIALLAGAWALNHFAHARLGMNRWLGYHNRVWEAAFDMRLVIVAASVILAALLVAVIVRFVKCLRGGSTLSAREKGAHMAAQSAAAPSRGIWVLRVVALAFSCIFVVGSVAFTLFFSPTSVRAYYLMAPCFFVASVIQLGKSWVILGR